MISEDAYKELEEALGPENVAREPAVLDGYAWQAFTEVVGKTRAGPLRPAAVVLPGSTDEVQAVGTHMRPTPACSSRPCARAGASGTWSAARMWSSWTCAAWTAS